MQIQQLAFGAGSNDNVLNFDNITGINTKSAGDIRIGNKRRMFSVMYYVMTT